MNRPAAKQGFIRWGSLVPVLLLILACTVGVALLAKGLYPVELPSAKNPDFIDTVFDHRAVLWAARLLLVSAAAVLANARRLSNSLSA
ncbi:MAG TPA: hypothetical protein VNM38_00400 [Solirubrobacterales bacterium]|nr:hypothetical protein [Solirubrobacterales bacterium]